MSSYEAFAQKLLGLAAKSKVRRSWLVVMPASGTVRRIFGVLLQVDLAGESGRAAFIVNPKARTLYAVDPRALVVDDQSLQVAYQPREHLLQAHPGAQAWFAHNPNVFCPDTESGICPIDAFDASRDVKEAAAEACSCGHHQTSHGPHLGEAGHGKCFHPGCSCVHYRWDGRSGPCAVTS